ncbi:thermonuclease family protein [Variovorax rhizosphaerae]|uniref:Thermonuclease family protein n=1 Tax=Variovorax rhizosphaerae TaxID=1836200 RepID=A0ABU8WNU0_9BURK
MSGAAGKRNPSNLIAVLTLVATCQWVPVAAFADVIAGRVVKVSDGDTITVLDASDRQHRIRLAGIDAPEKNQPFGKVSQQSLSAMVAGKTVNVETDKLDRYGRAIGVVLVGSVDVNREQVERGLAWWYRAYAREQSAADRVAYSFAEEEARKAHRGIWQSTDAVAPWEWRREGHHAQGRRRGAEQGVEAAAGS